MKPFGTLIVISLAVIAANWVRVSTTPGDPATIVSITDGDTVRLRNQQGKEIRVRLDCIDAPESGAKHGSTATQRLAQLTPEGSMIRYQDLGSGGFGRRAGELFTGTWPLYSSANRTLVLEGKAVVYPQYVSKCDRVAFWWDEKWARLWRRGVHSDPHFCPPWLDRRGACPSEGRWAFTSWMEALLMNPWAK